MSTPDIDPATKPGSVGETKTLPAGLGDKTGDKTMVGPALASREPPAGTPPPGSSPLPTGSPPPGRDYSLPILIGVFVLALVGIGLLGLGIYAVVKFSSNPGVAAVAITATLMP